MTCFQLLIYANPVLRLINTIFKRTNHNLLNIVFCSVVFTISISDHFSQEVVSENTVGVFSITPQNYSGTEPHGGFPHFDGTDFGTVFNLQLTNSSVALSPSSPPLISASLFYSVYLQINPPGPYIEIPLLDPIPNGLETTGLAVSLLAGLPPGEYYLGIHWSGSLADGSIIEDGIPAIPLQATFEICVDTDEDGFCVDNDCDDSNPFVNPGAQEVCNGLDDDCDGAIDDDDPSNDPTRWYEDQDGDDHGNPSSFLDQCLQPMGYVESDDDCDDTNPYVRPFAHEYCDGVDNDCDGTVDEDEDPPILLVPADLTLDCEALTLPLPADPAICILPDDGTGTVLPVPGLHSLRGPVIYTDPNISAWTIRIETEILTNPSGAVITTGGIFGGRIVLTNNGTITMNMTGTGTLAGFNRSISLPLPDFEYHLGPESSGAAIQTFPNEMIRLEAELFGDPDFDFLRLESGLDFGLPSPGQTTLTRLGPPGSNFNVDSFFDIEYRIDFQGAPGSVLEGLGGAVGTAPIQQSQLRMGDPYQPRPGLCVAPDNGSGSVNFSDICEQITSLPISTRMFLPDGTPVRAKISEDIRIHSLVETGSVAVPGGTEITFDCIFVVDMTGEPGGILDGFNRTVTLNGTGDKMFVADHAPGEPVQSFDTEIISMDLQLFGDPDFDLYRIRIGSGLLDSPLPPLQPSPGHMTLTELPSGNWNVDSFFDIEYQIDFQGASGGALEGMSGSTRADTRLITGSQPIPTQSIPEARVYDQCDPAPVLTFTDTSLPTSPGSVETIERTYVATDTDGNSINKSEIIEVLAENDSDSDGTCDILDACPDDPNKIEPGSCGCGVVDVDDDADGVCDDIDNCLGLQNSSQEDLDGDGWGLYCDCDDSDPDINPGANETCNGLDDDCDGIVDDACTCPPGLLGCDGACIDPQSDPDHCGTCNNNCPPGQLCYEGSCVTACPPGLTECDGTCIDTGSDPDHCGACGTTCGPGEICVGGTCQPCPPGTTACDGACVNLDTDPDHCGGCGTTCGPGEVCIGGTCQPCPPGTTACDGQCIDLDNDPDHCGACENVCPPGQVCDGAGVCSTVCQPGLENCGGSCVDLNSDNDHCGACGNTCPVGTTCQDGACVDTITLPPSFVTQPCPPTAPDCVPNLCGKFPLDYVLPELPLPGSVQLEFIPTVAAEPIVILVLNNALTNDLVIDLDSPDSSPEIISATPNVIVPGEYDITLSYQDQFGNPTASVSHTGINVRPQGITILSLDPVLPSLCSNDVDPTTILLTAPAIYVDQFFDVVFSVSHLGIILGTITKSVTGLTPGQPASVQLLRSDYTPFVPFDTAFELEVAVVSVSDGCLGGPLPGPAVVSILPSPEFVSRTTLPSPQCGSAVAPSDNIVTDQFNVDSFFDVTYRLSFPGTTNPTVDIEKNNNPAVPGTSSLTVDEAQTAAGGSFSSVQIEMVSMSLSGGCPLPPEFLPPDFEFELLPDPILGLPLPPDPFLCFPLEPTEIILEPQFTVDSFFDITYNISVSGSDGHSASGTVVEENIPPGTGIVQFNESDLAFLIESAPDSFFDVFFEVELTDANGCEAVQPDPIGISVARTATLTMPPDPPPLCAGGDIPEGSTVIINVVGDHANGDIQIELVALDLSGTPLPGGPIPIAYPNTGAPSVQLTYGQILAHYGNPYFDVFFEITAASDDFCPVVVLGGPVHVQVVNTAVTELNISEANPEEVCTTQIAPSQVKVILLAPAAPAPSYDVFFDIEYQDGSVVTVEHNLSGLVPGEPFTDALTFGEIPIPTTAAFDVFFEVDIYVRGSVPGGCQSGPFGPVHLEFGDHIVDFEPVDIEICELQLTSSEPILVGQLNSPDTEFDLIVRLQDASGATISEWTDHNIHDPGVTVPIEIIALDLVGIPPIPPASFFDVFFEVEVQGTTCPPVIETELQHLRIYSGIDSDGDSVCDGLDQCPGSDDNIDVNGDGLPDGCCIDPSLITPDPCVQVYIPVCGCDGITYSNECVAQNSGGVTSWTPGPCSIPCIDPGQISGAVCPSNYAPVCGCDGETYGNECIAFNSGVTSWTPGPCPTDCVDPSLISDDPCPSNYAPVCGCDGNTYPNDCHRINAGITSSVPGPCETDCIDPTLPDIAACPLIYEPVCGCDGETYTNSCFAQDAKVTSWVDGPCQTDCYDPALLSGDLCPAVYLPVCGCDGNTYQNSCIAQNSGGVTYWTSGPCVQDCVDPTLPEIAACPLIYDPVCGCDGETYSNDCFAAQAKLTSWTDGPCQQDCIDESAISPDPCPLFYSPVCGCDGNTYSNSCFATNAGVTDWTSGPCPQDCIDESLISPDACPDIWDPVCGCDGQTYSNTCEAQNAGLTSWTNGQCPQDCFDPSLVASTPCPDVFDPVCGCDGETYSNFCEAQNAGNSSWTPGVCDPPGCIDPDLISPDPCPLNYAPVCGCDGNTYSNECEATVAGLTSWIPGECPTACFDPSLVGSGPSCIIPYWPVCGCDGITYDNICDAINAGNSSSTDGPCSDDCIDPTIAGTLTCLNLYDPVCGCDGETYTNACVAMNNGVIDWTQGACPTDCIDPSYIGAFTCLNLFDPVCGCDGNTYVNSCVALDNGVTSWTPGACDDDCLGPPEDIFCITINYVCGCDGVTYLNSCDALQNGVTSWTQGACPEDCIDPSLIDTFTCPDVWDPVCGCDGNTYSNDCYAQNTGITSWTDGSCPQDCVDPSLPDIPACPLNYDPVCGCDGETYSNSCFAEQAKLTSWTEGPCPQDCIDPSLIGGGVVCIAPNLVCGCDGNTYESECDALNAGVTSWTDGPCPQDCIDESQIGTLFCPQILNPVCGCDGNTYSNACIAQNAGVTSWVDGPCNSDCYDPTLLGALTCSSVYDPVCGCDGETYGNDCIAQNNGISDWTTGPCPGDCFGPPEPVVCIAPLPVCGCDGVTYINHCEALNNGVLSWTDGPCCPLPQDSPCGCGEPFPGDPCDDGDLTTAADVIQADCSCQGIPISDEVMISDPCACLNNATSQENGQFSELVEVTAPSGQIWSIVFVNGLYKPTSPDPPAAPIPYVAGELLTYNAGTGNYELQGIHIDQIGYSIAVTNGTQILVTSNLCNYPNIQFNLIPFNSTPVVIWESLPIDNELLADFINVASGGSASGIATYILEDSGGNNIPLEDTGLGLMDVLPGDLIIGEEYKLTITFNEDGQPILPPGPNTPGCEQSAMFLFKVLSIGCD